jgi:hypothetical protein
MEQQKINFEEASKMLGLPTQALITLYNRKLGFLVDSGIELEKARELAYNSLIAQLRKDLSSAVRYEDFLVMPIGLSKIFDVTKNLVNRCLEEAQKDKAQAIAKGFIAPDGTPLDFRKTFSTGTPNFNYGKPLPLPPDSLNRYMIAMVKPKEGGKEELATIRIRGHLAQSNFEPFAFFEANLVNSGVNSDGTLNLSTGQVTNFKPLNKKVDLKTIKSTEALKKYFIKLSELNDWHEKNKDNFNRFFLTEADLAIILNPTTPAPNYKIVLKDFNSDFEGSYIAIVDKDYLANIGIGSRIFLVGTTMETEDGLRVMVMSLLPVELVAPEVSIKPVEALESATPKTESLPEVDWGVDPEDLNMEGDV